jgi:septal ring factor EnvC (AmiA/AmiB activator)
MASWIWVLIPLAAILVGGFTEWLKFKEKQDKLGASTTEIEDELHALEAELRRRDEQQQALERRIQNLETIVTSETWDALVDGEAAPSLSLEPLEREQDLADRTEQIARRLRG